MESIKLKMKSISFTKWYVITVVISVLLSSCVTTKKVKYLQDTNKSDYVKETYTPETYRIQPNDNLYIYVSTPDPSLSAIFNAAPGGGVMRMEESTASLLSYPVRDDGSIELPYIGSIEVAGLTLSEARISIQEKLIDYVRDASITVKLVNNYVSILGEVNDPGMYPIYKERLNIFQALAMAGDLADISNRTQLTVIRQTPDGSIIKEFDMTDKNIVDSEFYYVMPNDIIYAIPMKGSFFWWNQPAVTFLFTSITTAISLFVLIQNYLILN
jgi:polysaccharide export outer membrane protein